MMTKITLLRFFFSLNLFAAEGVIIVLEAPVFKKPTQKSEVVDTLSMGEKVFIHDSDIPDSPYTQIDSLKEQARIQLFEKGKVDFYKVVDQTGNPAFIKSEFVKVIYRDSREDTEPIDPFVADPTDYRLSEPLPKDYPVSDSEIVRALVSFNFGPNFKTNYPYNENFKSVEYKSRKGAQFIYMKNVSFDPFNRFYFGGRFQFMSEDGDFELTDGRLASESLGQFAVGPYLTYETYREGENLLTLNGSLMLTLNRAVITQKDTDGFQQERIFTGINVTPDFGLQYHRKNIFPKTSIFIGTSVQFHLENQLSAGNSDNSRDLWNRDPSTDVITYSTGAHLSFMLGIMATD